MAKPSPLAHKPHIIVVDIQPAIECGQHAIKRVVGDSLEVRAVIVKGGHDALRADVRFQRPGSAEPKFAPMRYAFDDDTWYATIPLDRLGAWSYTVVTWTDTFTTWRTEIERKSAAGVELSSELLEGIELLRGRATRARDTTRDNILAYADAIAGATEQQRAVQFALEPRLAEMMADADPRDDIVVHEPPLEVWVDRERARFGAWYELFPRSQARAPGQHGTFRDVVSALPRIASMGFDVIYLPPVHPIGRTNRKGKNNSLAAEPGDVGSPWAIGNEDGGHDAIEPRLGTIDDFDHLVSAAASHGIEVALDFAIQCSPDHPYVRDHPEWFRRRPDGSVKYAENPPKKYEDIVALDLWCDDYPALWQELKRVVLHWVRHGVRIFRVDNPHTKPLAFWEWLIAEVHRDYPDVFFLAEAFTRPNLLHELARIGFSQSYTYFTWRNTRPELEAYLSELATGPGAEYLRPNFFANTPDILHEYLQHGGRPAFKVRLALAATLSPTYGIYSGFELCENVPLRAGSEEYLDSEKYEIRQRDWQAEGNINDFIAAVNHVRRENPALHTLENIRFHDPDNPAIIAYSKATPDAANRILAVANLDPHNVHEATVRLVGESLGINPGQVYVVHDLLTGSRYTWQGLANYVRLDPAVEPVHLFRIEAP